MDTPYIQVFDIPISPPQLNPKDGPHKRTGKKKKDKGKPPGRHEFSQTLPRQLNRRHPTWWEAGGSRMKL